MPGHVLTFVIAMLPSAILYTRPYRMMRKLGRALGVNRVVARLTSGDRYENRFGRAFCATLRTGDCVWDVGANVGHFTEVFSAAVGPAGRVLAFEPSPVNAAALEKATAALPNVQRLTIALGNARGRIHFFEAAAAQGYQSRCLPDAEASSLSTIFVDVRRGDDIVNETPAATPNAIKIDVEGFELEVIEGLGSLLAHPELRTIGVEVHFALLEQRDRANTPRDIVHLLAAHGFDAQWADHSHLIGRRDG